MFSHLHTRSWYSFLSGGTSPEGLVRRASALGIERLALTDLHGVYGAVAFQQACCTAGITSVIGAEIVVDGDPLVLLARSSKGYANLCRVITAAHLASRDTQQPQPQQIPSVGLATLASQAEDIVCLSGGRDGRLYGLVSQGVLQGAMRWVGELSEIFGDRLRVELVHYLRPQDSAIIARLHTLARRMKVPVVAAGDVRYGVRDDYRRYDLLTCIRLGITIYEDHPERPVNAEGYMKSEEQLRRLIPFPEAFENACDVASSCDVDLLPGVVMPPGARVPAGRGAADWLGELSLESLLTRYPESEYERALLQLRKELGVITSLGLEEYFLVVREVVSEARSRGIRCAGRGSAANSIVAYLLGITGVDPLAHNLLFERFLHGGRKGTPDIDVDFDAERREEVIAWMEDRFGIEQTAMTATVVTYGLRMALRDVAKALGWSLEEVDRMTGALPSRRPRMVWNHRETLEELLGRSPLLDLLMTAVDSLDGCPRHLGLHNGGMILSRRPLYTITPVQISANGVTMVQFAKDDVEALGLVKLDVLGLRMLAAVSEAVELVERTTGVALDIDNLRLDDPATFNLIRSGRTLGTFQIESQGQMHLLAQHQPENFRDIISEIALFRPGPVQGGMVNPFIRRRRGLEPVVYEHPILEEILRDTYGVILFQEQVLEVAHKFAGMSMQEADDFRALISKFRSPLEMEGMRAKFVTGAVSLGVDPAIADSVFEKVSKFVGYGFCRSHAAAFAMTVYQSAWLKCHHPAAFMAAVMQHRPGMYNLTTLEEEARRFGVQVAFPDINRSGVRYELERLPDETFAIRKPLTSVTGLSRGDATTIVLERSRGMFTSVEDFYRRVGLDRDLLDNLARSGAFDTLSSSSRRALWEVGVVVRRLKGIRLTHGPSLLDLPAVTEEDIPTLPSLAAIERLSWDYHAQGSSRRHPMTLVRRVLNQLEIRTIETCSRFARSRLRTRPLMLTIAGSVILRQMPPTANGVTFITLEDETGYLQCILFPTLRDRLGLLLARPALIVRGEVQIVGNWRGIVVADAWELTGVIGGYAGYPSAYGGTDRLITKSITEQPGSALCGDDIPMNATKSAMTQDINSR
jgi:error-prone DNA polymerase